MIKRKEQPLIVEYASVACDMTQGMIGTLGVCWYMEYRAGKKGSLKDEK